MTRLSARLAGLLTVLLTTAAVCLTAVPAQALVAVHRNCAEGERTLLEWDDVSYVLHGTCGVVVVAAENTEVDMPTAQKLVIEGESNVVHSKPLDRLVVRGSDNTVIAPSVRVLRANSRSSRVDVAGIAEKVRLRGAGTALVADRVHDLRLSGQRLHVRVGRGYDARITGDDNRARFRRLGELVVEGHDNRVRVRKGRTDVRDEGRHNRVRVNRRG